MIRVGIMGLGQIAHRVAKGICSEVLHLKKLKV